MKNALKVSEHFFSVQGEGKSVGVPAVFLRLTGCKLFCIFCDTTEVWKKGSDYSFEFLYELFKSSGYLSAIVERGAHLVVTGGDPLIQQEGLYRFFDFFNSHSIFPGSDKFFVEVETEAVIQPEFPLVNLINQWNVSPKLANSGMDKFRRYKRDILQWHSFNDRSFFKFPVSCGTDLKEVMEIITICSIPRNRVWLMPICSTRQQFQEAALPVIDLCKEYGFNFGNRLHLTVWNQATGV